MSDDIQLIFISAQHLLIQLMSSCSTSHFVLVWKITRCYYSSLLEVDFYPRSAMSATTFWYYYLSLLVTIYVNFDCLSTRLCDSFRRFSVSLFAGAHLTAQLTALFAPSSLGLAHSICFRRGLQDIVLLIAASLSWTQFWNRTLLRQLWTKRWGFRHVLSLTYIPTRCIAFLS